MKIMGIGDVLTIIDPENKLDYIESGEPFKKWLDENDGYYYARPKEDFFEWEAIMLAEKAGKSLLVLENMS